MKYLYGSLFWFYDKIIRVSSYDTPHFYVCIVMAVVLNFVVFATANIYLLSIMKGKISYPPYLFFLVGLGIYFVLNFYFKTKSEKIIKDLNSKSRQKRNIGFIISFAVIVFFALLYFHTGDLIRNHNDQYL